MRSLLPDSLRVRLLEAGLLPQTRLARAAGYLLVQIVLIFLLQQMLILAGAAWPKSLSGTIAFAAFVDICLYLALGFRFFRDRALWRLRNRLIITYILFGVIPVVLLIVLALGSAYLFAGQFATFIVTSAIRTELESVEAADAAIAHEASSHLNRSESLDESWIRNLRSSEADWSSRHIRFWLDNKLLLDSVPAAQKTPDPLLPPHLKDSFRQVVRDRGQLYLRAGHIVNLKSGTLTVLLSEPFDQRILKQVSSNLGQVALYTGVTVTKVEPSGTQIKQPEVDARTSSTEVEKDGGDRFLLDTRDATATYIAGSIPDKSRWLDPVVSFGTSVPVVDWQSGSTQSPILFSIQTRVSKLYERLFDSLGDIAPAVEFFLLGVAIFLAIIEFAALWIGTRLTRTVTGTVAQLYDGTMHINRGDFSHRISVRSTDQMANLATSFNSMTQSLEELIEEQKQKQRLEGELAIAQEVQEQLYPKPMDQWGSLEVFGFCRPARTVSGDYYDFLSLDSENLLLAVGDISGKGISAALLMATIHSAVRAYGWKGALSMKELVSPGLSLVELEQTDLSSTPGLLLGLLNQQLYESTPPEKYATLFLAIYNEPTKSLAYSNGGHLPPIVICEDGSTTRLTEGGTVVGLFGGCTYAEGSTRLKPGDIFVSFSDGVTEPENEFGEFGEDRLVELIVKNRDLPLSRISEAVTAAVDDWIGAAEQPDDITLVLARVR